jgi:O-antigen/teichoic acid export membrane protein
VTISMSEALQTEKLILGKDSIPVDGHSIVGIGTLTRNSAIAMGGGVLSQGLKFLVVVYLARILPVSEFGRISFAIAVNAYMFVIAHFGLPVFGSRAVATSGVVMRGLLIEIATLRAVLAFASMLVCVGILLLAPGVSRLETAMVAIFGLSNVVQAGLFDWVFQGLHRQEVSAALNIIWQGGWLVLTVVGIHLGMGILSVPAALTAAGVIASVAGYVWLRQTVEISRSHADRLEILQRCWAILKLGAPLGWGTLLVTMLIWSDTLIVRLLRGQESVGLYAAGNRPALALAMLSSFYVQGAFPMLSWAGQEGRSALGQYFQHCYSDIALVFLPGALWAMFYAREIILLVFRNPEYLAAVPVFRVFQATFLLAAAGNFFGVGALVATHRDGVYQRVLIVTMSVFLPACAVLTYLAGNLGASVATLGAQALLVILFTIGMRGIVQPRHAAALLKPLMVGLAVTLVSRALGLGLYVSAGLLLASYAGLFAARFYGTYQVEGVK